MFVHIVNPSTVHDDPIIEITPALVTYQLSQHAPHCLITWGQPNYKRFITVTMKLKILFREIGFFLMRMIRCFHPKRNIFFYLFFLFPFIMYGIESASNKNQSIKTLKEIYDSSDFLFCLHSAAIVTILVWQTPAFYSGWMGVLWNCWWLLAEVHTYGCLLADIFVDVIPIWTTLFIGTFSKHFFRLIHFRIRRFAPIY